MEMLLFTSVCNGLPGTLSADVTLFPTVVVRAVVLFPV